MTFREWLQYAVRHRTQDFISLLPELKLKDGTELSVQASEVHMCSPKKKLENGDYDEVEVYTHGEDIVGFEYMVETSPSTYGYVSVDLMEEICTLHGGIVVA